MPFGTRTIAKNVSRQMKKMEKDIIDLHQRWIETEMSDKYGIIEFCCDDIEISPTSGKSIKGKTNFLNWIRESDNGSVIENIEISKREVICLDQTGSLKADFKTTIKTKDKKKHVINGQHVWDLVNENETWKVKRMTWEIR